MQALHGEGRAFTHRCSIAPVEGGRGCKNCTQMVFGESNCLQSFSTLESP